MKKLFLVVSLIFSLFSVAGCQAANDDVYDKLEIAGMFYDVSVEMEDLEIQITALQTLIAYMDEQGLAKDEVIAGLLERIAELEAREAAVANQTQVSRFFDMLVETSLLGGEIQFVKLGNTVEGVVNSWDYTYIVVELNRDADVEIIFTDLDDSGDWNMNLYHDNLIEPYHEEENLTGLSYGVFSFKAGWNIIELDSYSDLDGTFILRILEVL